MRDADSVQSSHRPFQHRLLLFAMPMTSRLHFFRLFATLTQGRQVVAENTFCPESAERHLYRLEVDVLNSQSFGETSSLKDSRRWMQGFLPPSPVFH